MRGFFMSMIGDNLMKIVFLNKLGRCYRGNTKIYKMAYVDLLKMSTVDFNLFIP